MLAQCDFGLKRPTKLQLKQPSTARRERRVSASAPTCTQLYLRQSPTRIFIASWQATSCRIQLQQPFMNGSVLSWSGYSAKTDGSSVGIGTSHGLNGLCARGACANLNSQLSVATGVDIRARKPGRPRIAALKLAVPMISTVMPGV